MKSVLYLDMKKGFLFLLLLGNGLLGLNAQSCPEIIGYFPNWQWYDRAQLLNPMTIQYEKYSIINYAFFKPETNGSISSTDAWADQNLLLGQINWSTSPITYYPNTSIIERAHNANTKVLPSIGGWTLSDNFPGIAASALKRTQFAHSCCDLIRTYNFDGIDIDWEYPGYATHSGTLADKQNFTIFLQQIKDSLTALGTQQGKTYLLTACFGASKSNMENIEWSSVQNLVDIINLMSYDYFGSWDAVANHNSPLFKPLQGDPSFNIDSSVTHLMTHYQVPANKIAAGVAFYGRSAKTLGAPALFAPITGVDLLTFGDDDGTPLYYNILKKQNLFSRLWDANAQVPYFVGNGSLNTFVSYDDEESIGLKAQYIKNKNLRGAIIWEITGDYLETFPGSGIIGSTPLIDTLKSVLCATSVSPNPVLTITPGGTINICSGNTQTLTASSGFSSYLWNTGDTTQSIQVSLAGTYSASATTNNNVTVSSNIVTINVSNCNNNAAPLVSILSPANNSSFALGSTTSVQVDAQDTDGSITLVELYRNNVLVGSLLNPPFIFSVNNPISGNYTLVAKAYDNANASTNSALVNVLVTSANNGVCGYPLWDAGTIYTTNDTVSYNNIIYRAKYWTQGNAPNNHYGNCCVWDIIMPCGGYTAATCFRPVYDSLIAYNANQEVFLNGNIYKAKWWTLNQNPLNNSGSGDVWLPLTMPCVLQLTLKLFMQGYYAVAGNMLPVLQNQNQISSSNQCDTVQVNFYQAVYPYDQLHTCKGIVQTNGLLSCELPTSLQGNSYYLSVKHRNSIETWSADPVLITFTNSSYDFSVQATKAFGANQIEMAAGIFAIYSGDINQDGVIDGLDFNDWENDNNSFAAGYLSTDLNGDGVVDGLDFMFWEMNSNLFVGMIAP